MDQPKVEGLGPVTALLQLMLGDHVNGGALVSLLARVAIARRGSTAIAPALTGTEITQMAPLRVTGLLTGPEDEPRFAHPVVAQLVIAAATARVLTSDYVDRGTLYDRAIRELSDGGMAAAPLLIELLSDADNAVAQGAAFALGGMGTGAVPALRWSLLNGNERIRTHALLALTKLPEPMPADDRLIDLVAAMSDNDSHVGVRLHAVAVLSRWTKPAAIEALKRACARSDAAADMARIRLEAMDLPEARRALEEVSRAPREGPAPPRDFEARPQPLRPRQAPARRPRVFLSYAREDVATALEYRRRLEMAGIEVWMDSSHLLAGDRWDERIRAALLSSEFAVVLVSRHTFDGYQLEELQLALAERPARKAPFLFPISLSRQLALGDHPRWPSDLSDRHLIVAEQPYLGWLQLQPALRDASAMLDLPLPPVLRREARRDLHEYDVWRMVLERNFFSVQRNPHGRSPSGYEDLRMVLNGTFVEDTATGLCWTRSSVAKVPLMEAYKIPAAYHSYSLNHFGFRGPEGLRLPTLEEAMSLMRPVANSHRNYRDPTFGNESLMLTCDAVPTPAGLSDAAFMVWVADFASADAAPTPEDLPWPVWLVASSDWWSTSS